MEITVQPSSFPRGAPYSSLLPSAGQALPVSRGEYEEQRCEEKKGTTGKTHPRSLIGRFLLATLLPTAFVGGPGVMGGNVFFFLC